MILAFGQWAPMEVAVDELPAGLDWFDVHPDQFSCTFQAPASRKVAVCVTYGIMVTGTGWAGLRDTLTGELLPGSQVMLAYRQTFKGQLSYDLVPLRVQPGRTYNLALSVRGERSLPGPVIELKTGPNHPTALIEVYS
jgi:hypothetical protein